jgi:RNA polymerase sigma-70 factor (ECF subfamily)
MTSKGEPDLIRGLCADAPSALEEAFRLYGARCKAIAFRILREDMRAEDAVQEAFLTLWRRRAGLVVRTAGIAPWLFVVTRNAALQILRGDTRRAARESATIETADFTSGADPSELVATRGTAQDVRAALQTLPPEQRGVVTSAYFGLRTLAQIAAETNTPLGTVKSRMRAALARLANVLEPEAS